MYREDQSGAGFMMGVLAGVFVGAGVALLFAPRSGEQIRQQIGDQYRGIAEKVGSQTQTLRERASQLRQQGRERLEKVKGEMSDRMSSSTSGTGTQSDTDRFPSTAPSV